MPRFDYDDECPFDGYDVYGVICSTYAEACEVAGIETPVQLAAEERYWAAEESIATQDAMEALGGPLPSRFTPMHWCDDNDDLPF